MIITSRLPTLCAASSMATSFSSARSPSVGAIRRSTFCAHLAHDAGLQQRGRERSRRNGGAAIWRPTKTLAELIRLGAYRKGSDPKVDEAMIYYPAIESFLAAEEGERADLASGYAALAQVLSSRR